jgi:hypothetical protein
LFLRLPERSKWILHPRRLVPDRRSVRWRSRPQPWPLYLAL